MIDRLRDHYIICGYGRRVADVFRESGVDYVVARLHADALEAAREHDALYIDGNRRRQAALRGRSRRAAVLGGGA